MWLLPFAWERPQGNVAFRFFTQGRTKTDRWQNKIIQLWPNKTQEGELGGGSVKEETEEEQQVKPKDHLHISGFNNRALRIWQRRLCERGWDHPHPCSIPPGSNSSFCVLLKKRFFPYKYKYVFSNRIWVELYFFKQASSKFFSSVCPSPKHRLLTAAVSLKSLIITQSHAEFWTFLWRGGRDLWTAERCKILFFFVWKSKFFFYISKQRLSSFFFMENLK